MTSIDLIWLTDHTPAPIWPVGQVVTSLPTPPALSAVVDRVLSSSTAEACLFWDAALGTPSPQQIEAVFQRPGDAWHGGLRMGMAGLPALMDFVDPTWMLNRDPSADIEATSWRMSLRCCLVRTAVLRTLGAPHPAYRTIEAASLELGLRWIQRGVFVRHCPDLIAQSAPVAPLALPFEDELRIIHQNKGLRWAIWALLRAIRTGYTGFMPGITAARRVFRSSIRPPDAIYEHLERPTSPRPDTAVSVLIPTFDRYPYLRVLLSQLRHQTIKPREIFIIDQTTPGRREQGLEQEFPDLPVRVMTLQPAGQCAARNLGLQHTCGDFIILLDDDVEVTPDLIESHLRTLDGFHCATSSGVAIEPNAPGLPIEFQRTRTSDVFPGGNSILERSSLRSIGLFDPAYDHGPRADHDLGMRLYLSGSLMVLNHQIRLIHHHAPAGGLRIHKARVITRDSSRSRLFQRHIPAATEIYLAMRYFSDLQVREMLLQRTVATLFGEGSPGWRLLKGAISLVLLPDTIRKTRANQRKAQSVFAQPLAIPSLDPTAQPVPAAHETPDP